MNWKIIHHTVAVLLMLLTVAGAAEQRTYPFYAYCMDVADAKERTYQQQAELLKELGYDGCGHLWLDGIAERLKTLDAAGLKLFLLYIKVDIAPESEQPFEPRLKDVLPLLKGRETLLAVMLEGGKPSDQSLDPHAVKVVRELAAAAASQDVRVALYPHTDTWLECVEDAIRIAKKVDRPNVGMTFNLCHWLRTSKDRNYQPLLVQAAPLMFGVSINGADNFDEEPGFSRYIQPLDRGSFDVGRFLKTLRQCGYKGPVGLQCYGIPGDARDHLARSIVAWHKQSAVWGRR